MKVNLGLHLSQRAGLSPDLENYVEPATDTRLSYAEMNAFSNRCKSPSGLSRTGSSTWVK